jgi:hypothetical protein
VGLSVGVKADYNDVIDESDDGNNSLTTLEASLESDCLAWGG